MSQKLSKKQVAKQIIEDQGYNFNTWLKDQLKEAKQAILIEETSEWHNVIQEAIFDRLLHETLMSSISNSPEKKKITVEKNNKPQESFNN